MNLILLPVAIIVFYGIGDILLERSCPEIYKNIKSINKVGLNLCLGISLHLLISHLISFFTQSYQLSTWITLTMFLICVIFNISRLRFVHGLILSETLVLIAAAISGIAMGLRDAVLGSADRIHLSYANTIVQNNIYPPLAPTGKELSLAYYHYGVDLICATFKIISGLDIWDALSFQIGFGTFLTFLTLYVLLNYFIDSPRISFLMTVIVFFYTSINSIDFFIREIGNLASYNNFTDYAKAWLLNSWTSVSHMTSQLRLLGQNFAFPLAFTMIYATCLIFTPKKNTKLSLFIIFLPSFALQLSYPTFWYPIVCGIVVYFLLQYLKLGKSKTTKILDTFFICLGLIYLSKILSFSPKHTEVNGINALQFSPSLEWIHWGKTYIRYFYDSNYLNNLKLVLDPVVGNYHIAIPLFSTISLREFGFSIILATIILIWSIAKKSFSQILENKIILIAAYASFVVPFLFKFILRPVETSRFLLLAKILALIFITIEFGLYLKKCSMTNKFIRFSFVIFVLILLMPGFISIIPSERFSILDNRSISNEDKSFLRNLEAIRSSGDVALDTTPFEFGGDFSSVAGFYGVGGQFYKDDTLTRYLAYNSMNPALLQELKVNYVITNKLIPISKTGLARLENPNWFQEVSLASRSKGFRVYKFIAINSNLGEIANDMKSEYVWVLGLPEVNTCKPIRNESGQIITANSKEEAVKLREELRPKLRSIDLKFSAWIKEQALYRSSLQ